MAHMLDEEMCVIQLKLSITVITRSSVYPVLDFNSVPHTLGKKKQLSRMSLLLLTKD